MATVTLYLDTRRKTKDGNYPVKIRVTHNRRSKYFGTKVNLDQESFDKVVRGTYLGDDLKKVKKKLNSLHEKVIEIIEDIEVFSFTAIEERLTGKGVSNDLLGRLEERIADNKSKGKIGTANIDSDTLACIKLYLKETKSKLDGHRLPLSEISREWLESFETWNFKRGISSTSIHIWMVRIRAAINQAIQQQIFDPKKYPFGKGKYKAPTPANNKRALSEEQLIKFLEYKPKTTQEEFAKDFWIFSLVSSGMNLGDVFSLRWSNFDGKDSFSFERRKTGTRIKGEKVKITIHCRKEHWVIIEKYGSRKIDPKGFVFDILKPGLDSEREHQLIKMAINKVNSYLRAISKSLEFGFNVTSYHARHSYASRLMKTAPIAYISKQLGHTNISTTENYLSNFTLEESKKYEENLLPKIG